MTGRAVAAALLLVGFYALALAIVAGLLYIPYAEVAYLHRINARLTIFAVVAALAILWGILPRFDRFDPPGPELTAGEHPRLFPGIASIDLGAAVNASVARR